MSKGNETTMTGVRKAIDIAGSKALVANHFCISHQAVSQWYEKGFAPPERFDGLVAISNGVVCISELLDEYRKKVKKKGPKKIKQGITQPEKETLNGTECPTSRSSDAASSSALESGIITQGCPSQPIEY